MIDLLKKRISTEKRLVLPVKVIPGASKNEIFGITENGIFKIRIAAPPEKGKANKVIQKFLAEILDAEVEILSGEKSPYKKILVMSRS